MPEVSLRLQPFENMEKAAAVADDLRAAGSVKYVDASGSEVSVTIGDVTVEG